MRQLILPLFLCVLMVNQSFAQTEEAAIQSVIETLFDGMRVGDSSMVASVFTRDAIMQTIHTNREGKVVKIEGDLAGFLNAVGAPHEQVWDERIAGYEIKIDGDLASAWTPYQFYTGDTFSHCGVNSFQLVKLDGSWKIIYIIDTRRRTECVK